MQYYPTGTSLALHDLNVLWSLLSIPLQSFLPLTTILNVFMLSCFVLNGLSFFLMAKEITGSYSGALAGSVIFAYCPFFLGRFSVSHIGFLSAFFIPPFILMLWRHAQQGKLADMLRSALFLALASLCHFYYGIALLLIAASYFVFQLVCRPTLAKRLHLARQTILALLLFIAILSPLIAPILYQLSRGDFDGPSQASDNISTLEANSADLLGFILPDVTIAAWRGYRLFPAAGRLGQNVQDATTGNFYEKTVYPGWTSWILLTVALFLPSLRRRTWPWILMFLTFFLWALGPTLYINGRPFLQGLLPLRILPGLPILHFLRTPTRFALFLTLGSGMLTATAISLLSPRRPMVACFLSVVLPLLALAEFFPFPQDFFPGDLFRSSFYERLAQDKNPGSVLNIPVSFHGARGGGDIFQYAQTIHGKPIVGGYIARTPRAVFSTLEKFAFLRAVEQREYDHDKRLILGPDGLADMEPTLRNLNIRFIIVHRSLISEAEWPTVINWLEQGLGPFIYEDQWIRVYRSPFFQPMGN